MLKTWLLSHHVQIRRLLPNRHWAFRFPGGRIYWNPKESVMMFRRMLGLYEVEMQAAIAKSLHPGDTFIDAGANKGDYTLLAAKLVGPSGLVLSFEPEPTNCSWIRRSLALNRYQNVRLFPVALGDRDGEAELHLGEKSGFHSLLPGLPQRECGIVRVPVRRLDGILAEIGRQRVDAMKIDTEGAEVMVLRGARETLARESPSLFVSIHPHLGVSPEQVRGFLAEYGFGLETIGDDEDDVLARKLNARACAS